jgi:hypothetical protein
MATPSSASNSVNAPDALSTAGLDMSNSTVQSDFLAQILDDTELQVTLNEYATRVWYGIVAAIGLAAIINAAQRINSYRRSARLIDCLPR